MSDTKNVRIDVQDGESFTMLLLNTLNEYPDLMEGEKIVFGDSSHNSGLAMYPIAGALVLSETQDVLGMIDSSRQYPFTIVYKVAQGSANLAISIKDFLDNMGKWLERQDLSRKVSEEITINDIKRQTVAALDSVEEDGTQNWTVSISLNYTKRYSD